MDFERAIAFSLKWEGGRNFNIVNGKPIIKNSAKNDLGGATAYGITATTLKKAFSEKIVDHYDICKLTQAEAKIIYRKNYWDRYNFGDLAWPVCMCCLDCAINHGGFVKILQRAANACGNNLIVDGIYGSKTFAALKNSNPQELATAIVKYRKKYYESLVANNPKQKVHLNGWLNRLNDMAKTAGVE